MAPGPPGAKGRRPMAKNNRDKAKNQAKATAQSAQQKNRPAARDQSGGMAIRPLDLAPSWGRGYRRGSGNGDKRHQDKKQSQ